MSITTADQAYYERRLLDYAEAGIKYQREAYDEAHHRQREPNDAEFLAWVALMIRGGVKPTTAQEMLASGMPPEQVQMQIQEMLANGAAWIPALIYDDGKEGMRILNRYERLTGLNKVASVPGVRPPTRFA